MTDATTIGIASPIVPEPAAARPTPPIVRARGLTKRYGSLTAVDGIDFDIPAGSIFGLIGPNGAGKSTTFAMIASLLIPTSGTVTISGIDPMQDPKGVRKAIGWMPDTIGVYGDLTVEDYLRFFAAAYRLPKANWEGLIDGLLELVNLGDKRLAQVDSLSRGMKQRVSLARALVHDPDLLILDEPASGLDPRARVELRELLLQLSSMGKTIVISSHILAELDAVCTQLAIMEGGRVHASGTPAEIRTSAGGGRRVRVDFLGGDSVEIACAGEHEQAALLVELVNRDPRTVIGFSPVADDLEGIYMRVTGRVADVAATGANQ